jgi:hypothetical protein
VAEIASQKFWPGNSRGFEVMNANTTSCEHVPGCGESRVECPDCGGTGWTSDAICGVQAGDDLSLLDGEGDCSTCGGTGELRCAHDDAGRFDVECPCCRGFAVNEHDDFTTDATRVERFAPLPPLVYEDRATRASDALTGAWMRATAAGNHAVADALATLIRRSR